MVQWLSRCPSVKLTTFPMGEGAGDIQKCHVVPSVREMEFPSFEKVCKGEKSSPQHQILLQG